MDLELSDEQRLIVSTVRDFVRREIVPREAGSRSRRRRASARSSTRRSSRRRRRWACTAPMFPRHSAARVSTRSRYTLMSIELSQHRAGLYAPCYGVFGGSGLAQLLEASDDQRRALPVSGAGRREAELLRADRAVRAAATRRGRSRRPPGAMGTTGSSTGPSSSSVGPTGRTSGSRSPARTRTGVVTASPASSSTPMRPGSMSAA